MNRFMLTGGFVGFLLVFLTGVSSDKNIFIVLRDSMIACLIMGFLLKILYGRFETALASILEKEQAAMEEEARRGEANIPQGEAAQPVDTKEQKEQVTK